MSVKISSSTLTEKSLFDIPAPVSIISSYDIEMLGVRYLHEILEYIPGVQVTRYSGYPYEYSVASRGLTVGSSSAKILILLDGNKINAPRSGNATHLANFSLNNVEKIELIRGPGSSIYGSNAFTGIINIITKKEKKSLKANYGTDLKYGVYLSNFMEFRDNTISLHLGKVRSDGDNYTLKDTFTNTDIQTSDPYNLDEISIFINNNSGGKATLNYRKIEMKEFYHVGRTSNKYNFSQHSSFILAGEQDISFHKNVDSKIKINYIITSQINGNQGSRAGAFSGISLPNSTDPLYGYGIFDDVRFSAASQNNLQIDKNKSLQFGFDWQINQEKRANGYTNFDLDAIINMRLPVAHSDSVDFFTKIGDESSQQFIGTYIQYQSQLGSLNFIVGGRFDYYPSLLEEFTPRLGAVYSYSKDWQIKILYGEAFRAPELNELTLFRGVTQAGNRNLTSESIRSSDLIIQYSKENLLATFNIFYNHYSNPIVNGIVDDGLMGFVNSYSQFSHGIELEFTWQIDEHSKISGTTTHFNKLPPSAFRESKSLASLNYTRQFDLLRLGLSTTYRSTRETPTLSGKNNKLDSFWYWRAFARYDISHDASIHMALDNITNDTFYNPSITPSIQDGIPLKGRNLTLGLNLEF